IIDSIDSPTSPSDGKNIRKELLRMREEQIKLRNQLSADFEKNKAQIPDLVKMGERNVLGVCRILKENGWLSPDVLKDDAFYALISIVVDNRAFIYQRQLLPVLVEASKKNYIEKSAIASLVDSIRVGSGLPQIFGTQAAVRSDAVYLYPILNEEKLEE